VRWILLMPVCVATLLSLTACSHSPWGAAKTMQPSTPPAAAAKPAATPPIIPLPSPTPDDRLAVALDHLGAKREPRGEVLTIPDREFMHGHAKLESTAADELKQLVTLLRDYPKADLLVEGYTDNRGKAHWDQRMSLERADVVKQTLVNDGLEATRISARGLGPADPIGDNATKAGREENRRVELVFSDSDGRFAGTKDQSKTG
jgi:outer membrane protein OmpA-like peptidoglycan-associated protein